MLNTIATLILGAIASFFRGWLGDKRAETAREEKGKAEAASETLTVIAEKADAQATVNAADRGGSRDVARRLRERLDKGDA